LATGYLRGAIEQSGGPGSESVVPTLSTKKVFFPIQSFAPKLGPDPLTREDELRGIDQPIAAIPGEYNPEFEYESRVYPDLTGFFLRLTLGNPTTTTGNGVITDPAGTVIPTGAYRHVWTSPFGPAGTTPLTAQFDVAYVDQGQFFITRGAAVKSVVFENPEGASGSNVKIDGPIVYLNGNADPSLTASYEAATIQPFRRGNLSIPTWLSGTATHDNVSLTIERAIEPVRSLGVASKWPTTVEYSQEPISTVFTGTLEQRFVDTQDWVALRDLTGFAAQIRWISDSIIASSYPYKLFVEFSNCQYVEGEPEPLANKRRLGQTFNFRGTSADGTTAANTVSLINATANYN
jgi:hypothetical protein